jgi:hypothetical protein
MIQQSESGKENGDAPDHILRGVGGISAGLDPAGDYIPKFSSQPMSPIIMRKLIAVVIVATLYPRFVKRIPFIIPPRMILGLARM